MSELQVKVTLANRTYPVKIESREESHLRNAARQISTKIREFENDFGLNDKQDLLAMTALQLVTELQSHTAKSDQAEKHVNVMEQKLDDLDQQLTDYLKKIHVL
jgi:cell division protein ZapA